MLGFLCSITAWYGTICITGTPYRPNTCELIAWQTRARPVLDAIYGFGELFGVAHLAIEDWEVWTCVFKHATMRDRSTRIPIGALFHVTALCSGFIQSNPI